MADLSDYGPPTQPRTNSERDLPPPPWPLSPDPRTDDCTHHWDGTWGVVGERQRQCNHCKRWIWEHSIWALAPASTEAGA